MLGAGVLSLLADESGPGHGCLKVLPQGSALEQPSLLFPGALLLE